MHLLLIIYPFIMLSTMIHVFYKLQEVYNNILFLLNIELQNCSVNIKRVYSDILSYNSSPRVPRFTRTCQARRWPCARPLPRPSHRSLWKLRDRTSVGPPSFDRSDSSWPGSSSNIIILLSSGYMLITCTRIKTLIVNWFTFD